MEPKRNILLVHNYYQIPGGEDTVVANEKSMLEETGHKVIFYSRNNSELKSFSPIHKLLLPISTIFNPKTYKDIRKIIKMQKIDVVHAHNTLNLISPSVYYAAQSMGVPIVQTIHNFRLLCPGATFYRDGKICEDCVQKGLRCAVKYGCYRGSKVQTLICVISTCVHRMTGIYGKLNYICLTEFNKKKLLELEQINPNQIYVKPNFSENQITDIISYEHRKEQFIFAGRLDKLKGIDFLLKTWKKMGKDAPKLVICGVGPMQEWCEKYITENKLYTVEYRGFVSNEQLKQIISESKALILPTQWYEGFPMTIVEAYSVGTPVIGPNLGNIGSLIIEKETGYLYEPNSMISLIETLECSMNICEKVKRYYIKHYSKSVNQHQLEEIYEKVINMREFQEEKLG